MATSLERIDVTYFPHVSTPDGISLIGEVLLRYAKPVSYYEVLEAIMDGINPVDVPGWCITAITFERRDNGIQFNICFPPTAVKQNPDHDLGATARNIAVLSLCLHRDSFYDPVPQPMRCFVAPRFPIEKLIELKGEMSNDSAIADLQFLKVFQTVQATLVLPVRGKLSPEDYGLSTVEGDHSA